MDSFLKRANEILEEVKKYTSDNPNGKFSVVAHTQYILSQFSSVIALAEAALSSNDYFKEINDKLSNMITKEDFKNEDNTDSVANSHKEILEQLKKMDTRSEPKTIFPTYSDIVKSGGSVDTNRALLKQRKPNEVVLVYGKEKGTLTSDAVRKTIQEKLKPSTMKIGVERIRKIADGGVAIELCNNGDAATMEEQIVTKVPELVTKRPRKRWPFLVIYSVSSDINKEDLVSLVFQQNEEIGDIMSEEEFQKQFRVKFIIGKKGLPFQNWTVEVSPVLRKVLLQQAKINIEWSRCRVADFCPILQCFRCNEFNHTAKECPHSEPTCSHCSEAHLYKECPNKDREPTCNNCKRQKGNNHHHNARDTTCPIYTRIKNNVTSRTDYGPC
ncbi:uncharacterized protein LOC111622954 [Centruroides sculpturatus]|uniref:uncharacterized protein LOC111622954 n=1 Tax=Centruroides sculpturatus TaxID=218467 RepID=UPI000C6DC1DA|nr:uncharacterized protein LOC111622954 [Centruroides sculpturatus]